MIGWFGPFFRGGAVDLFQCRFPHGAPFGVFFFPLFDTIHFGGIEEVGREFGEAAMGANGASESGESLGEIVRAAAITGEMAEAGMVWAPYDAANGGPARRATEAAGSAARGFYHRFTFCLPG